MNSGLLYLKSNKSDTVINHFYYPALSLFRNIKDSAGCQLVYYSIASYYLEKQDLDNMKLFIDSAVLAYPEAFITNTNLQMAFATYYTMKGLYTKALFYYDKASVLCERKGMEESRMYLYMNKAVLFERKGRWRNAYENQKAYTDLKDSLMTTEKIRATNQMEIKYRLSEKDKALLLQQLMLKEKEAGIRKQKLWNSGIMVSVLFLGCLGIVIYRGNQHKQMVKLKQMELEQLNARMQGEELERGRIAKDLHDGLNVMLSAAKLNHTALGKTYRDVSNDKTYKEVTRLLQESSNEVRWISYNLVPDILATQNLPDAIQSFCDTMSNTYDVPIEVQRYGIYTGLDIHFSCTVFRIIQEMIQNAVKHAEATYILLQLSLHKDVLQLTLEDNGKGFDIANQANGMGIRNLKSRIGLLKGSVILRSIPEMGTIIEIEIPVQQSTI